MSESQTLENNSYLTFMLGDEIFASHVSNVIKILEMQRITEVPRAPSFMKGVINLRGNVLPVIDARIKFGLPATLYTERTCILVLNLKIDDETVEVGAIVDAVNDVIEYSQDKIQPAPRLGSKYKSDFIDGVMKLNDQFIMILNMNTVFSTEDIIDLQEQTNANKEVVSDDETSKTE
nr:chemotaxis protein CheW [Bacteroidota bacterium]